MLVTLVALQLWQARDLGVSFQRRGIYGWFRPLDVVGGILVSTGGPVALGMLNVGGVGILWSL